MPSIFVTICNKAYIYIFLPYYPVYFSKLAFSLLNMYYIEILYSYIAVVGAGKYSGIIMRSRASTNTSDLFDLM